MGKIDLYLDINSQFIKMMVLKKGKEIHRSQLETPSNTYNDGVIVDPTVLGNFIGEYLKEHKLKPTNFYTSLTSSQSIVRQFTLPVGIEDKELMGAIELKLNETLPDILQSHTYSYKIYSKEDTGIHGMVTLAPNEIINSYLELCKVLKLTPQVMDIGVNCASKYDESHHGREHSVILLEMGYDFTQIALIKEGQILLHRPLINGLNILQLNLAKQLQDEVAVTECIDGHYKRYFEPQLFKGIVNQSLEEVEEVIMQIMDFIRYNKLEDCFKGAVLYGDQKGYEVIGEYFQKNYDLSCEVKEADESRYINLLGCTIRQ